MTLSHLLANTGHFIASILGALCFCIGGVVNRRDMQDADLRVSVALPTSAGTSTSAALDLQTAPLGRGALDAELVIAAPLALGVAAKTHTYTILECDTLGGSYTAAVGLGSLPVNTAAAGAGTGGSDGFPVYEQRVKLQIATKRFLKLQVVGNSGSGDSSAASVVMGLRF